MAIAADRTLVEQEPVLWRLIVSDEAGGDLELYGGELGEVILVINDGGEYALDVTGVGLLRGQIEGLLSYESNGREEGGSYWNFGADGANLYRHYRIGVAPIDDTTHPVRITGFQEVDQETFCEAVHLSIGHASVFATLLGIACQLAAAEIRLNPNDS